MKGKKTGILDVKGNMIYEGDIILGDSRVYWNKERGMWAITGGKYPLGDYKYRYDFLKSNKKRTFPTKEEALKNRKKGDRIYYDAFEEYWYLVSFDRRNKLKKFFKRKVIIFLIFIMILSLFFTYYLFKISSEAPFIILFWQGSCFAGIIYVLFVIYYVKDLIN